MREMNTGSRDFESFRQSAPEITPADVLGRFISKVVYAADLNQLASETSAERQAFHQLITADGEQNDKYEDEYSLTLPSSGTTEIHMSTNGVEVVLQKVERVDSLAWLKPKEADRDPAYMTFDEGPLPLMERTPDIPRIKQTQSDRVEPIYSLKFPIDSTIELPADPKDRLTHMHAARAKKEGGFDDFRPTLCPQDTDHQQGFASILRIAAQDIKVAKFKTLYG